MSKIQKSVIGICIIGAVVLSVIYFLVPFPKSGATHLSYAFTLFSIVMLWVSIQLAFKGEEPLKSKVYGYPLFMVGYIYLGAQLLLTVIVCGVNAVYSLPLWIPSVVSIVLLGLALTGLIAIDNSRDTIKAVDKEQEDVVRTMKLFRLDISATVDRCRDGELKRELEKLRDEFKYSDPVSCPELEEIEHQLREEMDGLDALVESNDVPKAREQLSAVRRLLTDRNRRCKAYKK